MKLQENNIEIQENDMEHLLMQYCQGTLSGEERSRVEAWLEESPEHRRLASQIEMLYLATDTLQLQQTLNTEKALKKVKRRMSGSRRTVIWMWMQRAAAILFLPVLTALLVEYFTREDDVRMMEVRTNPGMIATVVLPDNSVVHLNSMSTLTSLEADTIKRFFLSFSTSKNASPSSSTKRWLVPEKEDG